MEEYIAIFNRVSSGSEVLSKDSAEIKELAMEIFRGRLFQVKGIIGTKALAGGQYSRYVKKQLLRRGE